MRFVACALVQTDPVQVLLADDVDTLHRRLAIEVVARERSDSLRWKSGGIREALLDERWGDAVVAWIEATGVGVDFYATEPVYGEGDLPPELFGAELQFSNLFDRTGEQAR